MTFGETVKQLRRQCKLSQYDLAESIGVSQPTIASWENGTRKPDITTISKLASLFNITSDMLLGIEQATAKIEEDRELWELREAVRRDSERYYLLSFAKDANAQDVREVVAIIEAVRKVRRES